MDDTTQSRASDIAPNAARRKRRSSILKSQRPARTPFSELEFNVATPTDTAKSRRVSFSKRTGVAEFITNEATTTWRNVYEEHNKSLESSGNDSEAHASRQTVECLGKRIFDQQFEEVDVADLIDTINPVNTNSSLNNINFAEKLASLECTTEGKITAPLNNFELSALTDQQSKLFGNDFSIPNVGEMSGRIDVNFSAINTEKDDLDEIEKDLERVSNVVCVGPFSNRQSMSEYIEVDLNSTHVAIHNEESDMSITDTVHSPKVQDVSKSTSIDKNINLNKDWMTDKENIAVNPYAAPRESLNFAVNDEPDQVLVFDGKRLTLQTENDGVEKNKSYRQTLVPQEPHRKTIVLNVNDDLPNFVDDMLNSKCDSSGFPSLMDAASLYRAGMLPTRNTMDNTGNISMTQALPSNIITEKQNEERKTFVFDNDRIGNISVTQALPGKIIIDNDAKSRTMVYEDDIGNISVTQALPGKIMVNTNNNEKRKTIVFNDDQGNISVTQGIPSNIIAQNVPEKRKTIVFEDTDGDISVTQAIPSTILPNKAPETRKTIVFEDIDGDISVTQAIPSNILSNKPPEKRKTIVFEDNDGDISVTKAMPSNIISQKAPEKRKTIVFEDNAGDISVPQAIPSNIISQKAPEKLKTIVFEDNAGDISVTQAIPSNIISQKAPEKRKTIVFEDNDGDISVTQAIPSNIIPQNAPEKRKTIVFEDNAGDISVTQAIPSNIISQKAPEKRKTIVFEDNAGDISVTQAIPSNIISQKAPEKRKTIVFEDNDGDISVTQAIPSNIIPQKAPEKRKTIVFEDNAGDISVTQAIPSNIISQKAPEKRKTIVFEDDAGDISVTQAIPSNIISQKAPEKRKPIVFEDNDADISVTQAIPSNIIPNKAPEKRKTIVFEDNDADISVTQAIPSNIIPNKTSEKRNTFIFEDNAGDISVTQAIPTNIIQLKAPEKRKTIVFEDNDGDISVTHAIPSNIIPEKTSEKRKTIVFEDNAGDISVTQAIPYNIIPNKAPEKRKTIVFEDNDGDISVTQAIPANILMPKIVQDSQETVEDEQYISSKQSFISDKRKTIVDDDQQDHISMTQAILSNIIHGKRNTIVHTDEQKDIPENYNTNNVQENVVYDNDAGDVSMNEAIPTSVLPKKIHSRDIHEQLGNADTRKRITIAYDDDLTDVSMAKTLPANATVDNKQKRQTIVEETAESTTISEGLSTHVIFAQQSDSNTDKYSSSNISSAQCLSSNAMLEKSQLSKSQFGISTTQSLPTNSMVYDAEVSRRQTTHKRNDDEMITQDSPALFSYNQNVSIAATLSTNDGTQESVNTNSVVKNTSDDDEANIPNPKPNHINVFLLENMDSNIGQNEERNNIEEIEEPIASMDINEADISMEIIENKTNKESDNHNSIIPDKSMVKTIPDDFMEIQEPKIPFDNISKLKNMSTQPDVLVYQANVTLNKNEEPQKATRKTINNTDNEEVTLKKADDISVIASEKPSVKEILKRNSNISALSTFEMDIDSKAAQTETQSNIDIKNSSSIKSSGGILDAFLDMSTGSFNIRSSVVGSEVSNINEDNNIKNTSIGSLDVNTVDKNVMVEIESSVSVKQGNEGPSNESMFYITQDTDEDTEEHKKTTNKESKPKKKSLAFCDQSKERKGEKDQKHSLKAKPKSPSKSKNSPTIKNKSTLGLEYKEEPIVVTDLESKLAELKTTVNQEKSPIKEFYDNVLDEANDEADKSRYNKTNKSFKGANDTNELLEMISNFTDKTKCEDIEPSPVKETQYTENKNTVENTRKSFAPQRLSIVMSREDLLNNISMAQAAFQKSRLVLDDTDDISIEDTKDEDSADFNTSKKSSPTTDFNNSKRSNRMSNEVVKTLQFDDESASDTSLKSELRKSPLKKTVFGETSYMNESKSKVIPSYLKDVSDGIKELMLDLTKPVADVLPFNSGNVGVGADMKRPSTCSTALQANLITSSQVDIDSEYAKGETAKTTEITFQPCNRRTMDVKSPTFASEMPSNLEERRKEMDISPKPCDVIVFDHQNPLNNVLIGPMDYNNAHKYNPIKSEELNKFDSSTADHVKDSKQNDNIKEVISTQYNIQTIPNEMQGDMCRNIPTDALSLESNISKSPSIDQSIDVKVDVRDNEVNTVIAMKENKELLAVSSSLTLVDDNGAVGRIPEDIELEKRDEITHNTPKAHSINEASADIESNDDITKANTSKCKKRIYSPAHKNIPSTSHLETTPKPSSKLQKISNSPNIYKSSLRISPETKKLSPDSKTKVNKKSPKESKNKSPIEKKDKPRTNIIIQQLITDYNIDKNEQDNIKMEVLEAIAKSECDPTTIMDVQDEKSLEAISSFTSSKNMKGIKSIQSTKSKASSNMDWEAGNERETTNDCDAGINVVTQIDMLQFMGTIECEWESSAVDTWCFRLLHGRIRLSVRLAHRHDNATRTRVRADTPVLNINAETVKLENKNTVATLCVRFATETMQHIISHCSHKRTTARDIPPLLRRCAAVARVALRWGRAMHDSKLHLAYALERDGRLTLKVANIPLRSVWEVSMRVQLVNDVESPYPRATDVQVIPVVSDVIVSDDHVKRVLGNVPNDWGHAPRSIWRIFRYLKNRTKDDELLLGA